MSTKQTIEAARAKLLAYREGQTAEGRPHPTMSLRHMARDAGMSPTGLAKFLAGTEPYSPTIRRVVAWYVRQQEGDRVERARHLIEMLAGDYDHSNRAAIADELFEAYERITAGRPLAHKAPTEIDRDKRVGKRYTVLMDTCPECHKEVPRDELRQHLRAHRK